jgi:hypothetical protein
MFKIVSNPVFRHDVDVQVPVDGGYETQSLRVEFLALPVDRLASFDLGTIEGQDKFLAEAVKGFSDLVDDQGKPVTCTDALRRKILGMGFVRSAVMAAYTAALTGARTKN